MQKFFALCAFLLSAMPAMADDQRFAFGGDEFAGGDRSVITAPVMGDAFAGGFNVQITAPVADDVHAIGMTIAIDGDVGGNVYAAGNSVAISGRIGRDLTATGASVVLSGTRGIAGNVRLAGGNVVIGTPVAGSVAIAAGSATLAAPVSGDFAFTGDALTFTDQAVILGQVTIDSPSDISVPAAVADPARVTIRKIEPHEVSVGAGEIARHSFRGFWPLWLPAAAGLVVFVVAGIVWLALFPERSLAAYRTAMTRPWRSLATGAFGLAAFIGLIPVTAMTIIGIPLVPVAVILLILAALIGYIAGIWFLATRVLSAFGFEPATLGRRVLALLAGLVIGFVLGMVPFLGWLFQLALAFLGLGAMLTGTLARWSGGATAPARKAPANGQKRRRAQS